MQGITILAENQKNVYGFNSVWFWWILGAFFVAGIILGIAVAIRGGDDLIEGIWTTVVLTILVALIGLFVALFFSTMVIPVGTETIYDVIIEENVSFSEFIKHYEIIEQNGLIYTVREIK